MFYRIYSQRKQGKNFEYLKKNNLRVTLKVSFLANRVKAFCCSCMVKWGTARSMIGKGAIRKKRWEMQALFKYLKRWSCRKKCCVKVEHSQEFWIQSTKAYRSKGESEHYARTGALCSFSQLLSPSLSIIKDLHNKECLKLAVLQQGFLAWANN